jgi:hypothetical protein
MLEIFSRSMSFWCYQSNQEMSFPLKSDVEHTKNTSRNHCRKSAIISMDNSNHSLANPTPKSHVPCTPEVILDLRNALQSSKHDLEQEKKRSHELADLLHEKTKHCAKVQVLLHPTPVMMVGTIRQIEAEDDDKSTADSSKPIHRPDAYCHLTPNSAA